MLEKSVNVILYVISNYYKTKKVKRTVFRTFELPILSTISNILGSKVTKLYMLLIENFCICTKGVL